MALNAGTASVTTGTLAKAIYDKILAASDLGAFDAEADPATTAVAAQKAFAAAIAQAVVEHITANAEVSVTVTLPTGVDAEGSGTIS